MEMCVRGYHVYRRIWEAAINEELVCTREPQNSTDCYTVAVIKDGRIVGTYPEILPLLSFSKKTWSTTLEVWKFLAF